MWKPFIKNEITSLIYKIEQNKDKNALVIYFLLLLFYYSTEYYSIIIIIIINIKIFIHMIQQEIKKLKASLAYWLSGTLKVKLNICFVLKMQYLPII